MRRVDAHVPRVRFAYPGYDCRPWPDLPHPSATVRKPAPPFAFSRNAAGQKQGPAAGVALLESML